MMNSDESKKKVGRPAKAKEFKPAPAPKVQISKGLVSKDGLWEVVDSRGDLWIITPTPKHKRAAGKMPVSENQLKELFEV